MTPDVLSALVAQCTFGSVAGFCSGFMLKRVGKAAALTVGAGFMVVQALSYSGYVHIEWDRVHKDVVKVLDVDGDGKLTEKDVHSAWEKLLEVAQFNLPSTSGFVAGLVLGLRC